MDRHPREQTDLESSLSPRIGRGPVTIHPKEALALKLGTAFWVAILCVPAPFVVSLIATKEILIALACAATGLAAGAVLGWLFGAARFRGYKVHLMDDGLLVQRGVFWQSETFVPRSRIQHSDVNQGPLDRRWGMAKLVVHTAGTRLENISVSGLFHPDALSLRDVLLDRREGVDGA